MDIQLIAGILSTTIFALSNVPMLVKAATTRSLSSYSYVHILMNNAANGLHWIYISELPIGPIWFLHGFYTLSAIVMLILYLRYECRRIWRFVKFRSDFRRMNVYTLVVAALDSIYRKELSCHAKVSH
jgi:hypothetical protein